MENTASLELLPDDVLKEIYLLEEQAKRLDMRDKAQEDFMSYVHHVYDNFIEGTHHRIIAEKLERIAKGDLKRLIVNQTACQPDRLLTRPLAKFKIRLIYLFPRRALSY